MGDQPNINSLRIFVSGAAGVIGSQLVKLLVNGGATVLACDRKLRPRDFPPEVVYRCGDLNDLVSFEIESFNPSLLIHLAASFERSEETSQFWYKNFYDNIKLSNHILGLMKNVKSLRRIVFASSYLIYDSDLYLHKRGNTNLHQPLNERDRANPRNLIGAAKFLHESELSFVQQHSDQRISYVSARIFRGYGVGSRDVISRWVQSAIKGEEINVYNPEGTFDYIFSKDTAEGLIRLAVSNFSGVINLGTGRPRQISEVVNSIQTLFPDLKVRFSESAEPVENSCSDNSLLRTVTGWEPATSLEEAIVEIAEYESLRSTEQRHCRTLISSASSKIPLIDAFENASRSISSESEIFPGDSNDRCLAAFASRNFLLLPEINELNGPSLLKLMQDRRIKLVVPTRDGELEFFASHANEFKSKGIHILGSSLEVVQTCLDKLKFYQLLGDEFNVIKTSLQLNLDLLGNGPFVVKERYGAGSLSLGLNLDFKNALLHAKSLREPVFQPFISGEEFSVDGFVRKDGILHGISVRERQLVVRGESQVSRIVIDDEINQLTKAIINKLNIRGHFVLQLIRSNSSIQVLECNPRIGGASTHSFAAGLATPLWAMLEALDENLDGYPHLPSSASLQLVRKPKDEIRDFSF